MDECEIKNIVIEDKKDVQRSIIFKRDELQNTFHESWLCQQYKYIDTKEDKSKNMDIIEKAIKKKISSYKQQDIRRTIFNNSEFITYKDCIRMLSNTVNGSTLLCYYCHTKTKLIYNSKRDMEQWSLDRLNNNLGHNLGNVVISCLRCNLEKRRKDDEKFKFQKQFYIVKEVN
tara:strand:- start:1160 stop:1678 length:519 start_codon:yes stop_codon:yes gene_type:complete